MRHPLAAVLWVLILVAGCSDNAEPEKTETFETRVVATGLTNPWEIIWGPDGYLWVTEKTTGLVTRVRPVDGAKTTAVTIDEVVAHRGNQDGLLGMALHPDLLRGTANQYVYLAYTYDANPAKAVTERTKIARYRYDAATETLVDRVDLLTGLPASLDHDSGRLVFGPDAKLYHTIGDQGKNQLDQFCRQNQAQVLPTAEQVAAGDRSAYQGKVLRFELDGSVPSDNPVLDGVRSHVFSYGHRNAQGLVFGRDGRLYASEQGPKTDDEINLIRPGGNYGWPRVAGLRDDASYVYADWSASAPVRCESLRFSNFEIPESVPTLAESSFTDPAFVPPIRTFETVPNGYNFLDPACSADNQYFLCWPTVAPSSLDFYDEGAGGLPGWGHSLLMPTLKDGTVYRVPLSADGTAVAGAAVPLWKSVDRYRDTAINPDRRTFYVATDSSGSVLDAAGRPAAALANPGAILEFRYPG